MCSVNKKIGLAHGKLYGIGIGPGDPELLTLKAARILKTVDFVFAPRASIKVDSMAAEIIKGIVAKDKIVTMVFPMEHDKVLLEKFWHKAARRIYKQICLGHNVAFVTIGDPFLYSTYIYLIRKLRAIDTEIVIETIPGISAINAAAAAGEVPLAESKEKIAIIPLPKQIKKLSLYLNLFDTIVLMKVGKSLRQLISFLRQQGLEDSTFFASRLGCRGQYLAKGLKQITKEKSGYLSTMIIRTNKTKKAQR